MVLSGIAKGTVENGDQMVECTVKCGERTQSGVQSGVQRANGRLHRTEYGELTRHRTEYGERTE